MFVQSKWAQDNFQKMSKNEPVIKFTYSENKQTETERKKWGK